MASERHKTQQKCKIGDHAVERKRKGGEEALRKNSWRKRNPSTASGRLCWLPPAPSSEPTQVLGLLVHRDLQADGTSDGSHAAAGAGP